MESLNFHKFTDWLAFRTVCINISNGCLQEIAIPSDIRHCRSTQKKLNKFLLSFALTPIVRKDLFTSIKFG